MLVALIKPSAARLRVCTAPTSLLAKWRSYSQLAVEPPVESKCDTRREVYVEKMEELDEVLESCHRAQSIALDTEFIHFPKLVPRLELVQLATPDLIAVVDYRGVKSEGMIKLGTALSEKEVVVHSGDVDMRLLGHVSGRLPKSLFDTSIAAAFVGRGQYRPLNDLINDVLGTNLMDKTLSASDWSFRPLSRAQVTYAMDDVRYLLQVRDKLEAEIRERGRWGWFKEEMDIMASYEHYEALPADELWKKIRKPLHNQSRVTLAVLRELCVWRDELARAENLMHNLIMRDEMLMNFAIQKPHHLHELKNIQGIKPKTIQLHGVELLRRIKKGLELPESELPTMAVTETVMDHRQSAFLFMMQAIIRQRSEDTGIGGMLFFTDPIGELRPLAMTPVSQWESLDHKLLKGWRRDAVGNDLVATRQGKKALVFDEETGLELIDQ